MATLNYLIPDETDDALTPKEALVAGINHVGLCGEPRQKIIAKLRKGEPIHLIRMPGHPDDSNAIALFRANGQDIGFLTRELAEEIAPRLDVGSPVTATVSCIEPFGDKNRQLLGVRLSLVPYRLRGQRDPFEMRESLSALFGERRIAPPVGFAQGGASVDSPDMDPQLDDADELGPLTGVRLAIIYDDAKGERTQRFVVVDKAFHANGVWLLQAHCELRGSLRTFRVDRIREIIDTRTGEVHEKPARFLSGLLLVARARGARRSPRTNPTERLIAESEYGLTVLLYFAQTDRKLRRNERKILWNYLEWQQERCSIEGRVARRPLNSWMDALVPDTEQFTTSLGKLLDNETIHSHYVLARVPEIVMADGCADDEEKKRLRTLLGIIEQFMPPDL
jgi:hypothetical protein